MYPIPPTEKLVETKTCKHCSISFPITDKDMEFYDKVSPVFAGKKYSIPTPTLCPDCREQRRLSFRNERILYKRKCDMTGEDMISMYSPNNLYRIYEQKEWLSDNWDPLSYGRDFDFSLSFSEQFADLHRVVPRKSLNNDEKCENSSFVHCAAGCKNSYLIFNSADAEQCLYGVRYMYTKNCVDCFMATRSEYCYECIDISDCYESYHCSDLTNSSYCYYVHNSKGCKNCLLCSNLSNREYCILNQQYSKEEYVTLSEKMLSENTPAQLRYIFTELCERSIHKNLNIQNSEDTIGDYVHNAKDSFMVFNGSDFERVKYANFVENSEFVQDANIICCNSSLSYEVCSAGLDMYGCLFSNDIWPSVISVIYSDTCANAHSIFGCVGLRNKSYCILNKQYTKEQYEALVPRIIEHMKKTLEWGEFFPSSLSPFGYNETLAQEYYPLSKKETLQQGFNWSDYEAPFPKVEKIIPASKLPEDITQIPDDILNWAIECEVTHKPFRIIKQELEFYRKHNLPIPRRHPDQRHLDRMALRNPRKLFERKCDKCGVDMITTYAPERPEIVYCESCYEKEIV